MKSVYDEKQGNEKPLEHQERYVLKGKSMVTAVS